MLEEQAQQQSWQTSEQNEASRRERGHLLRKARLTCAVTAMVVSLLSPAAAAPSDMAKRSP